MNICASIVSLTPFKICMYSKISLTTLKNAHNKSNVRRCSVSIAERNIRNKHESYIYVDTQSKYKSNVDIKNHTCLLYTSRCV